jgi:hypothetical protein
LSSFQLENPGGYRCAKTLRLIFFAEARTFPKPGCFTSHLLRPRIWPSFSPSCRLYPPGRSPLPSGLEVLRAGSGDGVEPEAGRPRVFLRQDLSTRSSTEAHSKSSGRVAQDKLTLRRTIQVRLGSNPAVARDGCSVARPPRLSEQARDGRQARPSSRSRDSNS